MTTRVIRAGRVVCPLSGIDGPGQVVVRDAKIVAVEVGTDSNAAHADELFDFPVGILLPGLVDLHAHPASANSVFGVPPDEFMLPQGVTTVMSQGDAGADNVDGYVERTVRSSRTRVLLAINLSRVGESTERGCFENPDDADVSACVDAVARHPDVVRAVSVNASHHACGSTDPREILRRGLLVADETKLPLLYGMRRPEDWSLAEQLELLRPGDIVTYCFRREPHCIVENGHVLDCVQEARRRGVLFDVGHGTASFCFDVAAAAIRDGFLPDTISTDLQARHRQMSPQHSLPLVMSKLLVAGMAEADVFRAVTATPARTLELADLIGCLQPGASADFVVLKPIANELLEDVHGQSRSTPGWAVECVFRGDSLILSQNL
jgi:dihydroorotase